MEPDQIIQTLTDAVITGGGVDTDGMHLILADGRVIIITGFFVVGLMSEETLQ